MLKIVVKLNDRVIKKIETAKEDILIGRSSKSDLHIDNLAVSGRHARIIKHRDHYAIQDLDSTNGTYLNGKHISKDILKDKDQLTIGKHTIEIFIEKPQPAATGLQMEETVALNTQERRKMMGEASKTTSPQKKKGKIGRVTVLKGSGGQTEIKLTSQLTLIGKDPNAVIQLEGFMIPQVAGFISKDKKTYNLLPPEKKNKLKLNGETVESKTALQDADEITIGGAKLKFHFK